MTLLTTTSTIKYLKARRFKNLVDKEQGQCLHATLVDCVGKCLEVFGGAKAVVELCSVGDPVTVVGISVGTTGTVIVLRHGADPDCARVSGGDKGRRKAHGATHWQ